MADINDTIYPQFPKRFSEKLLRLKFTPSRSDKLFVNQNTKTIKNRYFLQLMLTCTRYLNYVPSPTNIPAAVTKYMTHILAANIKITNNDLKVYQQSRTFTRHSKLVREHLKLKFDTKSVNAFAEDIGTSVAHTHEILADIINAIIHSFIREQYQLPAFSTLVRIRM